MREIEFRGKLKASGEWVYGHYYTGLAGEANIVDGMLESHEVEPETIGQKTGLKYKDGKDVYEGDIYGRRAYWNYYIGWHDGAFVAIPCDPVQKINWKWFRVTQESLEGFEVIGNIYENPEILQG